MKYYFLVKSCFQEQKEAQKVKDESSVAEIKKLKNEKNNLYEETNVSLNFRFFLMF